ncbi:Anaphase-promoting complex subunit 10 [Morella rubra]|uniref:Anaphase-promoting complex subunit 10 n=1 Tax=Morella rubra TaxID=262757 RepID=A0A6A1VNU6_9ROSI|nr:Anaphase-promoting complex subunit 10 [Morella rubra]
MATESSEGEEEAKVTGGNQVLMVEDDLREMGKKAAWSVSSCKPGNGVSALRDDNLETYWQSDGAQPHLVNIQFQKKVRLQLVVLYVDFKLDESYTPSKISIRAGDGFHNLKEIKTMELVKPTGWVYLSLSGNDPRGYLCQHFYVANCCVVKPSEREGYSRAPDQTLWASTEPYSTSAFSLHFERVYHLLCRKMI